jgi:hypothetical protein
MCHLNADSSLLGCVQCDFLVLTTAPMWRCDYGASEAGGILRGHPFNGCPSDSKALELATRAQLLAAMGQ